MRGSNRRRLALVARGLILMTLVTSVVAPTLLAPIASTIKNEEAAARISPLGTSNERMSAPPTMTQSPTLKWHLDIAPVDSSAVVTDVDGDNKPEVIINWYHVYCLSGNGGVKWIGQVSGHVYSTPTVSDVDEDGKQEILVSGDYDRRLYCLNWTGGLKWTNAAGTSESGYWISDSSPVVADIDQDSKKEVLVGSAGWMDSSQVTHPGYLICFNASGVEKWAHVTGGSVACSPTIADVEKDSKTDILFGSTSGEFYCLNSTGGQVWNYTTGASTWISPVVADIDGDGKNEVLCAAGSNLNCLNSSGGLKWVYDAGSTCLLSSNVTDVDGDEKSEIILGTRGDKTICLSEVGEYKWSYTTQSAVGGPPVVADVDDDNQLEILSGTMDRLVGGSWIQGGVVYCLDGFGALKWTYATGSSIYDTITVADVDLDGRPEMIVSSDSHGLYCLSAFPSMLRLELLSLPLISVGLVVVVVAAAAIWARKRRNVPSPRAAPHREARARLYSE